MAKYRYVRILKSGPGLQVHVVATGEDAGWTEADAIPASLLHDPDHAVFERHGTKWAPASHWLRLSTEPEAFMDELLAGVRTDAVAQRSRREEAARQAAKAEAAKLRESAAAATLAAEAAEAKAASLEGS